MKTPRLSSQTLLLLERSLQLGATATNSAGKQDKVRHRAVSALPTSPSFQGAGPDGVRSACRGDTVCKNNVRVFRQALEGKLLSGLQDQVMRPGAVEYILDNFESAVLKALDDRGGELEQMRKRKAELEREVANLTQAVVQGDFPPGLRAALVVREREIGEITAKLLECQARFPPS